ncbi:hypothetical protein WJX77_003271 [Trebouxia sp. C0004]
MVQVVYCLVNLAEADLATASFKTLLSILRSADGCKELEEQVQDVDEHRASAIVRKLLHASRAPEGGPRRSSKQAVRAIRLIGIIVANKSFVSKLQVEEQSKVLKTLLHRLHTPKAQKEVASIYMCLSQQHLSPLVLHQSAEELAVAIKHGLRSSYGQKIVRTVLACLCQLFDQIPADFSAKAHLWLPSLWRLLLVQPEAPYTEENRKDWAAWAKLRQQAVGTFTQVWSRHGSSLSKLSEHIQEELLLELLGTPAGSLPAGSHGLVSIMTAWTSACWDSGSAEKDTLQELPTAERQVLAVDAISAWCCFLDLLGAAFLKPGVAIEQAMTQILCDVFLHSGSLVLLEAAVTAWKKLADTVMKAGQLSMRQKPLLKPVIQILKTCHTPDAYQAALGLWKHMAQLASKVTGEDPASKAATWTLIGDYITPVLLALAAMPPGVCGMAGLGQEAAASSAVSQAIEWLVSDGPGEGMLITLLHKVVKKCSGIEGRKAHQSTNKPSQDAHKLVMTAIVGETSRLISHCSGRSMDGVQQVLLQTVANADCNSLHEANFQAWQKLCDELNMCKQLEVQQHFLLHIITEALAADKGGSMHQAALAMWKYLLELVCPVPSKASTAQRSLLISFTAPMLLALAAMPAEGLDQVQPLWLQVLDRWLDSWPDVWMLPALVSKLRYQIGISTSVTVSQADAQPSGIVSMQVLAAILQKMCCVMAEHSMSDSPAELSSFTQYHKSAQELYSELCHEMVTFPAQDEGAKGASTHVLHALGACFMHMSSASVQAFMSDHHSNMLYCLLPSAVAMLGSCTELIKAAPAHGLVNIILPDDTKLPLKALLPREWSRVCSTYWLLLSTGDDLQLAHQSRTCWQPGSASIRSEMTSSDYLPMTLEVCSALMQAIITYMLAVDAFAESDEDVTAAVAFAGQVLQIPLKLVRQSVAAGDVTVVRELPAGPESESPKSPEGPSKVGGQGARGTTSARKEMQADMREGVVELSRQDVVSWYTPWQNLYLVVAQVARCRQACLMDHTEALARYLLSFAADMRQKAVDKAVLMSPGTTPESGSGSCKYAFVDMLLGGVCKRNCEAGMPSLSSTSSRSTQACNLSETSLEHLCHAALASPGIGMGYISALLDAVPDACASLTDTQQPLMKAVAGCIQLVDHATDRRTTLLLEASWKAVIAAFTPRSMMQLTQLSIDELVLQPMAAALMHGSQAMQDVTREFWGNSGIGSVLSAFDMSIVESALASLEHHSTLLALKKAVSAGILPAMSWSDSGSLEIETDAGLADPSLKADAMAEGDSADKVAPAPAQAKGVVQTQVQLATVNIDEMAMSSCAHATRPTPANQPRTAEVTAVHAKHVTFAATSPDRAVTAHVATAVTGAKQVHQRLARGGMVSILRRRQAADLARQQQQQQQQQPMQASVMHQQLESQTVLPPANSAHVGVCLDSQPGPSRQSYGNMDHTRPLDSTCEASGSHQQPREEDASSSKADQVSGQPTENQWKGRTRGTACKDSCLGEQPFAESLQVASESQIALDSAPLPSRKTAKGKAKPKKRTQGERKDKGEGRGAGESRKRDKDPSPQAHAQSNRRKTPHQQNQQVAELDSLDDVEPVKESGVHVGQASVGQHHPQQGDKQAAHVAGLRRLCKLLPKSSDGNPLGPLDSKISEAEAETQAKNQKLSSKPLQATHAAVGTVSVLAFAHHIGHAAQAAQGAEGAKAVHAIKPSQRTSGCITSVADALNNRDHSSQPDGSKPRGKPRHCQQAGCSSPVGTGVQVPGTQPQAREEPRLQSSSPNCLQGQITFDQPSQAMLPLNIGNRGPCLPHQACLPVVTEPDSCGKRTAKYSPQAREVAYKRARGSMHDGSLAKQNVPTQGAHDTQPAEPDLQGLGEAHSSHLQASLPADGFIEQGRQKATEEATSGRSPAAAQSVDMHDSPCLCLELDNEHQVLVDTDNASVATLKVGSLVASSVATTELVQASIVQHEHASTAQSARAEQDACYSKLPSEALGLTLVEAAVNQDTSNRDEPGQSSQELAEIAHGKQPVTQDKHLLTAQITVLATREQQGGMGAPCRARPASSSSAGPASRQAPLAIKRHAECSASAEQSTLKKARNGLSVDQDPEQHPKGTGTSIEDMQVYAKRHAQAESASPPSLSMQDLTANLVQQMAQVYGIDAKKVLPEAAKQASDVASLHLNKAYYSGYKDFRHGVVEYCMKTSRR